MRLEIKISNFNNANKFIALYIYGVVSVLLEGRISIEDAERAIFKPKYLRLFEKYGLDKNLIEALHLGTELEDIESLLPNSLRKSLLNIQEILLKLIIHDVESSNGDDIIERLIILD